MLIIGPNFRGELRNLLAEKALKKFTTICAQNKIYVGNTKEKQAILI